MTKYTVAYVIAIYVALSALAAVASPLIPADWQQAGAVSSGTLAGTSVVLSGLDGAVGITFTDLSEFNVPFNTLPLDRQTLVIEYASKSDWTIQLGGTLPGLYLYASSWRPDVYTFDRPYEFISGFGLPPNSSVVADDPLDTSRTTFSSGILFFEGPIDQLSVAVNGVNTARQFLTFAAVPEPVSSMFLATLAATAFRGRRLRP